MKNRIIFGSIAAVLLVALVGWGTPTMMLVVTASLAALGYYEYDRLFFTVRSKKRTLGMIFLISSSVVIMAERPAWAAVGQWICFVAIGVSHVFRSNRQGDFYKITREMALMILAYLYLVGLFGFLVPIVKLNPGAGRHYLFLLFLIVFIGDTAAYFVGLTIGKHRLATLLSPKKSIEGCIGALVASVLVAWGWLYFMNQKPLSHEYVWKILLMSPVASGLAQLGDLFESMFKRSQLQKDSGVFLPGHGGILDRVDGLALVSPVYYFYLYFLIERV